MKIAIWFALLIFSGLAHAQLPLTDGDDETPLKPGKVIFKAADLKSCHGTKKDCGALRGAVTAIHEAWIRKDLEGYLALTTPDIVRMSQQSGEIQRGPDEVRNKMPEEWRAFEGVDTIAVDLTVRNAQLAIDGDTATATYEVEVTGGDRWEFDDYAIYFQAFARGGNGWRLTHQTDSWDIDFDADDEGDTGNDAVEFDYVYPVNDLHRAVNFYKALLGEPEFVTATRASFNLGGARFLLDSGNLHGYAKVQQGLPSGYAEFHVKDLRTSMKGWQKDGVQFLTGIETRGPDIYALAKDLAGNVFLLIQRNVVTSGPQTPAAPVIDTSTVPSGESLSAIESLMGAWLRADKVALATQINPHTQWFDDNRTKKFGVRSGLAALNWDGYDRTPAGLRASMELSSLNIKTFGSRMIASYQMVLTGTGDHPFRETSMVTQVFSGARLDKSFFVASYATGARALSLDYVAYPVTKLTQNENFYTDTMGFGSPYSDVQYRGYWSPTSVFGIYVTDPSRDGLPRARQTNGYASFWIKSAQDTYDYLKRNGSSFPVIGAITKTSGVDHEPGYTQIYATDSEGNGALFTEYLGN